MSHGIFESLLGSEVEVGMARQASADKFNTAVYDVREKLGPSLFASRDVEEFRDRVAMMKNDQSIFKVIEAAGLHPATGTVRSIVGKNSILEEEFKARLAADSTVTPGDPGAGTLGTGPGFPSGAPGENTINPHPVLSPAVADAGKGGAGPAVLNPPTPDPTGGLLTNTVRGNPGPTATSPGEEGNTTPAYPIPSSGSGVGTPHAGRRRRADFEGVQDIDSTFSKDEQGKELKPKDDWKGYLNSVDQDAPSKVKRNFASKESWNLYRAWCDTNGKSAARLSSLDAYATNLSDVQYMKLANTLQACNDEDWGSDHHPKTPNTKLKKTDKVAGEHNLNRLSDPTPNNPYTGETGGIVDAQETRGWKWRHPEDKEPYSNPREPGSGRHHALRQYVAWCDRNGYSKVAKSTIDYYVSRVAGAHDAPPLLEGDLQQRGSDPNYHFSPELDYSSGSGDKHPGEMTRSMKSRPGPGDPSGRHRAALRKHLYAQVATTIRWARTQRVACWPGCHENEAHVKKVHKDKEARHRQGGGSFSESVERDYERPRTDKELDEQAKAIAGPGRKKSIDNPVKESRRRTAAPDYLQKADDALTQLLNQKAQEFQETIQPLQMALQTVQQAEQLQQQQNPLNVLPPAGTVNVMPGGGQPSTADQVGMPDPNAQDTSGLAALLSGAGGTAPNDAPMGGGGQGAPPPAAAGGGLPPDMDPNQGQQMQARRRHAVDSYEKWPPSKSGEGNEFARHPSSGAYNYDISHPDAVGGWSAARKHYNSGNSAPHYNELMSKKGEPFAPAFAESWKDFSGGQTVPGDPHREEPSREAHKQGRRRKRQARGVGETFDAWKNKKTQSGDLLRGGDPDYDQFANETGVGERALNKLKQRNQTPDFAPINGVTVGNRKRAYDYPNDNGTSDDFNSPAAGHEYHDPAQQNGWKMTHSDDDGNASWSHPTGHSVTGRDGPTGGSWQLHGPKGPMGHPHRSPEEAQRSMPRSANRKKG
jgi:hypothetical protein